MTFMRVSSCFSAFTWPEVPLTPYFEKLSLRVKEVYSRISNKHSLYILGGVVFLGVSVRCYYYLKPVLIKVKLLWRLYQTSKTFSFQKPLKDISKETTTLILYVKGNEELKTISLAMSSISSEDQQRVCSSSEIQILKDLKRWDCVTLFTLYKKTYVRGGHYEQECIQSKSVLLYIQRWRTKVLQKVLLENFRSQIGSLSSSIPAENELLLLMQKLA